MKRYAYIAIVVLLAVVAFHNAIPLKISWGGKMGSPVALAQPAAIEQPATSPATSQGDVWATTKGTCYHTANCKWLAKSTTKTSMSLAQAQAKGLNACPTCEAPK